MTIMTNLFTVLFHSRDFQPITQPRFTFKPLACSWRAMGGPERARIAVFGDRRALPSLSALLGVPITIHDPHGDPYWWGYLHGVSFHDGRLVHGLNLERLANRVAVLYTLPACTPAGWEGITPRMTPWAEDLASQSLYGVHERILELVGVSESGALAYRDTELALNAYPHWAVGRPAAGGPSVILECRGWYETLAWRYYACDIGYLGNIHSSPGVTPLGTWAVRSLAQSFTPASSWSVESVGLRLRIAGSGHDDQFKVEICVDTGGQPGAALGMVLAAPSGLPAGMEWTELALDNPILLNTSTLYWLVLSRSGTPDDVNYYIIDLDEELGFSGGTLKLWDGITWQTREPDADLVFALNGNTETTAQMAAIVADAGQFLSGTRIETPSGVFTCPWHEGRMSALAELEALLALGDSDGPELLARVDENRNLVVERKLRSGEADWQVVIDGSLVDKYGVKQPRWRPLAGRWLKTKGWAHAPAQSLGGGDGAGFVGEWEYRFL